MAALILILTSFLVQLLRGTKKSPSILGIERCSGYDNLILAVFLTFIVYFIVAEVRRVQRE